MTIRAPLSNQHLLTDEQNKWLGSVRSSGPQYKHLSNSLLYEHLRDEGKIPSNLANKEIDKKLGYRTSADLSDVDNMVGLAKLTDTIGDWVEDYETLETAYERSLTGQTRRMLFGQSKFFDIENPDDPNAPELNAVQDILASAVSFSMPLDALTMGFGIRTGGLAARGRFFKGAKAYNKNIPNMERFFRKKINKGLDKKGYRGLTMPQNIGLGMVEGAFPLAFYEGAMGYVGAKINNQNPDNEEMDVAWETAKGVIHGGVLGAITGGVTTGVMSKKAMKVKQLGKTKLTKGELKRLSLSERSIWRAASGPGTIALESGIFTGVETLEKLYHGEDVRVFGKNGILSSFMKNAALFGTLKGKRMAQGNAYQSLKSVTPDWFRKYANKKISDSNESVEREMAEKFENEVNDGYNSIKSELQKIKDNFNRENDSFINLKKGLEGELKYLELSVAKGKEHFENDAKALAIHQNVSQKLDMVVDYLKSKEGKVDASQEGFLQQKIKEFEGHRDRYENAADVVNELFNKSLDGEGTKRDEALSFLSSRNQKTVIHKGKKVDLLNPTIPLEALERAVKDAKDKEQTDAGIIDSKKLQKLDEKLELADPKVFREGKSPITGVQVAQGEVLLRRQQLADLLGSEAPKSIKGTKGEASYLESVKYIDSIIQNVFPTAPQKGGTGAGAGYISMSSLKNYTSHLNKFAEYLAKQGKSFTEATKDDVVSYLSEPGSKRKTHTSAINTLVKFMNSRSLGKQSLRFVTPEFVQTFKKDFLTQKQLAEAKGLKPLDIDLSKGEVSKLTSKAGVKKNIPITAVTKKLAAQLNKKYKTPKGEGMARDSKGKELYSEQINALFIQTIGKLPKGKSPARVFRNILKDWAEGKVLKHEGQEIKMTELVSKIGLGQITGKGLEQTYGIKEARAKQLYKKIINDFSKDINNHISGKKPLNKSIYGVKEEGSYNILEVANALKKIVNSKDKQIKVNQEYSKKQQKFTIDKEMAEFLFRYMMEVPSRLNEVVRTTPTKASELAQQKIEQGVAAIELIEKNIQKELDNKTDFEIGKEAIERNKRLIEIEADKKSFTKTERYKNRQSINFGAKNFEREIVKLKGKSVGDNLIREAKLAVIGLGNLKTKAKNKKDYLGYEISVEKGVDSKKLELYRDHLKQVVDHINNPKGIQKKLEKKGFDTKKIKSLAIAAGVKNGDITKLSPKNIKFFNKAIEEMGTFELPNPDDMIHKDPSEKTGGVQGMINKIKYGPRKAYIQVATKLNELSYKSKGKIKKEYDFLNDKALDIDFYKNEYRGEGTFVYNKHIKTLPKEKRSNMYWHDKGWMKEIINVVEGKVKKSTEEFAEYKKLYDQNIESYTNAYGKDGKGGKPGTPEYEMIQVTRTQLDKRVWDRLESFILEANKELKTANPSKYQREVVDMLKSQKEADYMPHYVAEKVKKKLRHHRVEDTPEMNKIIEKIIKSKVEKEAEKLTDKKFVGFKKLSLGEKLNLTRGGKKVYKEAFKSNVEKIRDKEKYKTEAINELYNTNTSYELTNTRSFSELKNRNNRLPLVMKDSKGNVTRSYKDNASDIFGTYFLSSSQFLAIAKTAPEFLTGYWKNPGPKPIESSFSKLKANTSGSIQKKDIAYVESVMNELVGAFGSNTYKALQNSAYLVSAAGLSAVAEPGVKNVLLGHAMLLATHGTRDYTKALWRLAGSESWNKGRENAIKRGAIDYVVKEFGEGSEGFARGVSEGIYELSLMKRGENFNRIVALEVSKISAARHIEILGAKGWEYSEKAKNESGQFLKDVMRYTQKELQQIETGEAFKNKEIYNKLLDKAELWGHRTTQGGVDVLDLPKWMSRIGGEKGKSGWNPGPFLVFQKIATSVTGNLVRNIVGPAVSYGNFSPLFRFATSSYLSGEAQYQLKKLLYPLDDPESIGTPIGRALQNLWKAEFLGMFATGMDVISPVLYNRLGIKYGPYVNTGMGASMRDLEPALLRLFRTTGSELLSMKGIDGKSTLTFEQALKNALKKNIVLYSQMDKISKSRLKGDDSKAYLNFKNTKNIGRQYELAHDLYNTPSMRSSSTINWYYKDLEYALQFGSQEEIAKTYYDAFDYRYQESFKSHPGFTPEARFKYAHQAVMSSSKSAHPLNFSNNADGKFYSNLKHVEKWVKRQPNGEKKWKNDVKPSIARFEFNIKRVRNIQTNNNYMRKYSSISEAFDFIYSPK